ncbi:MAG: MmgE/PrpD family protein [Chloroflexi bacterium]|nr:MmgE/PrpD family protein [Chloroflexota bacterium]
MTHTRDLALQSLDLLQKSSVAYQFARYALGVKYESLPAEVLHQTKRSLLDTLGCAIGAFDAPGRPIVEDMVKEMGGPAESTVFGSGMRTSAANATLVNCLMVRFLDYNDVGGGGHNSDAIPGLLAVAEREGLGGRDFLPAMVVCYELGARVQGSLIGHQLQNTGWTVDVRAGLIVPPAVGKLMKLSEDQIAHATGICACHSLPLGILDCHREENSMTKNLRFGFVSHAAIMACMLARKGFTGPLRIVEGDMGFKEVIIQGKMDLERLTDFSGWQILKVRHKALAADAPLHGYLFATLAIVKENDLKPGDIASIHIKANPRGYKHTAGLARKYPRNAESADHSSAYASAVCVKERAFGPEAIGEDKFTDPVILDLIDKVTVEVDMTLPEFGHGGASIIMTNDGRCFEKRIATPHGFGDDPMTDAELEAKFRDMAVKWMSKSQVDRILDMCWNIEKVNDIKDLTRLMVLPKAKA